jgi:hypothetical protein
VVNQAVDLGMVADLSVVVPKAADLAKAVRVDKEARAAKARIAIKRKKYTMGSRPLSLETRKIQEMDPKEMPQKAENPSTKVRESLETLTKPSDF